MVNKEDISKKLKSLDKKIEKIRKEDKIIEKEEKIVERKIDNLSKKEENIEKIIFRIGKVNLRKKHVLELIRASAGAFLGVGIGRGLIGLDSVAKNLGWINILGILIFILGISALLVYKDEKENIQSHGKTALIQRVFFIYLISITIELISLFLFNVQFDSIATLMKIIIVGSYTAMASAITFSLAK